MQPHFRQERRKTRNRVLEVFEVRFEQKPLRGRVIKKAVDEATIEGFFGLVSLKPVRFFPPCLQISPGQPLGTDWAVVDKDIVSTANDLHIVIDCIAEAQVRFHFRREDEVFRGCPDTLSNWDYCENGVAAGCVGLLKFYLTRLECCI